jgi:hypothetical protein
MTVLVRATFMPFRHFRDNSGGRSRLSRIYRADKRGLAPVFLFLAMEKKKTLKAVKACIHPRD